MPDSNPTSMKPSEPALLQVADYQPQSWPAERARWFCDQLERGHVLFFPSVPFDLPQNDREFLLSQKQTGSRFHKNIAYRPSRDLLKGVAADSPDRDRLLGIMRHFSEETPGFVASFLPPYAGECQMGFSTFPPPPAPTPAPPLHPHNDF